MSAAAVAKSAYAWAIHYRGPAQYQVRIRRKHWPRLNRTFERLPDAEAAVRSVEDQMQLVGKSPTEKKFARYKQAQIVTLGDFIRKRLNTVEAKDPKSVDAYRFRALSECFLADLPIADLQPAHFEAYIESREDDDVCGATIRRELHMLSGIVSKAMRSYPGVLVVNPASAKQIDYPEDSEHRNRRLMPGEEEALLTACRAATHSPFLLPMVEIALETAARQGEIRTLAWSNIHFERGYIYLPVTKTRRPRSIPLTDHVREVLLNHRQYCLKRAKRLRVLLPDHVFFNGELQPVTPNAVKIAFRRARDAAGLKDFRFHDLRHEATSRFFERHALSITEVMTITGHRHTSMLERYTHLFVQDIGRKMRDPSSARLAIPLSQDERQFLERYGEDLGLPSADVVKVLVRQAMHSMGGSVSDAA